MVFKVGNAAEPVAWYFADPAQPWAPEGNQFTSLNWNSPDSDALDLGETTDPRSWSNGKNVKTYPVYSIDRCPMDDQLVNGLSTTTGPWEGANGKLLCCYPSVCDLKTTDVSHPPLKLEISSVTCPCIDGLVSQLTWNGAFWDNTADPLFCGCLGGNFQATANLISDPGNWLLGFGQNACANLKNLLYVNTGTCADRKVVVTTGEHIISQICLGTTATLTLTLLP